MIVGYHLIFGMYGFWLPNDPRGSWSDFMGSLELYRRGRATKTTERRSVAGRPHAAERRRAAKHVLRYPAVVLTDKQIVAIGAGFARYYGRGTVPVWACAIMTDHVHLVVGRPPYAVEQMVIQLKGEGTRSLVRADIHPLSAWADTVTKRPPKCFGRGEWKVFLDAKDVPRAVGYVEGNPMKEGRPRQQWPFVTSFAQGRSRSAPRRG